MSNHAQNETIEDECKRLINESDLDTQTKDSLLQMTTDFFVILHKNVINNRELLSNFSLKINNAVGYKTDFHYRLRQYIYGIYDNNILVK